MPLPWRILLTLDAQIFVYLHWKLYVRSDPFLSYLSTYV